LWLEKVTTEALRLARFLGFEQEAFGRMSAFLDRTLDKLMRYETAVTRHFNQAIMRLEDLQRERKAEMAQMEASELGSGSVDPEQSAQVSSSNTSEPSPPVGPTQEDLILESMDTVVVEQPPTENYGTNPRQPSEQFIDDEFPPDEPDHDDHDDGFHPRLTKEDLLGKEDYSNEGNRKF